MLRILCTVALSALAIAGTSVSAKNHGHHGKKGHHHGEGHMHKSYKGKIYGTIETDVAGIFRGTTTELELPTGDVETKETYTPNLAVSAGYFLTNQLAARAGLKLKFSKEETDPGGSEQKTSEIGFALGVNYSFMKHVCKSPYLELGVIYSIRDMEDVSDTKLFGGQASLGYRMPLGKGGATWSPSFDYRYLTGETEASGADFDTKETQWTVNLVKFDYFF